ncbi:zinc finger HIT domain-containing protein 3 isoform X2 [Nematolebias whitei]|uniref:zinc finger HIT domain-containing protein 3 isoform X2 n=1 Tax=Nematolebias whitei TaxID=451745 RepID=UPI00189AEFBC|nr:zinc finger HIT domain-containing protein 3 isoform X2 [Nematolebias whitei]XP_037543367.1 zinc finger HIT domain-containing protein 3 isoform X2 [Nematolebias whitei]
MIARFGRTMQTCTVCSEHIPKYRCPSCKIRYCSLGCYKKHKDLCAPDEKPASLNPGSKDADNPEAWSVHDLLQEADIIDKVPLQRLQLLGQSKELRDLLCNPHLRRLLRSVDSAESKAEAMKAAMQEPLFVEFSDQCLTVVEKETNGFTSDNDCDL